MGGGQLDRELTKQLSSLVDKLTTTGALTLDTQHIKQLKNICKTSDLYVEHVFHLLMSQLSREHAEIRFSTFQIIDELFNRSHLFRNLLIAQFQTFLELTVETDQHNQPLPPPKAAANRLKTGTLKAIQQWHDKYSSAYKKLALGYHYLQKCKHVNFSDIRARTLAEQQRHEQREQQKQRALAAKLDKARKEYAEMQKEITDTATEAENCIELLLPKPDDLFADSDFVLSDAATTATADATTTKTTTSTSTTHTNTTTSTAHHALSDTSNTLLSSSQHKTCDSVTGGNAKDTENDHSTSSSQQSTDKVTENETINCTVEQKNDYCHSDKGEKNANSNSMSPLKKDNCHTDKIIENTNCTSEQTGENIETRQRKEDEETKTCSQGRQNKQLHTSFSQTAQPNAHTSEESKTSEHYDSDNNGRNNKDDNKNDEKDKSKINDNEKKDNDKDDEINYNKNDDEMEEDEKKNENNDNNDDSEAKDDGNGESQNNKNVGKDEEEEEEDEEDDFEDMDTDEAEPMGMIQTHGLGNRQYRLEIEIGAGEVRLQETDDNRDLFHSLKDASCLVSARYLPQVVKWLEVLSKTGGSETEIKAMIDLKVRLENILAKCTELRLVPDAHNEQQSDSDDDMEEVPEKEGYEPVIPDHLRSEYGLDPILSSSNSSLSATCSLPSSKDKATKPSSKSTKLKAKGSPQAECFGQGQKKTAAYWDLNERQSSACVQDPTSRVANLVKLGVKEEPRPSTSTGKPATVTSDSAGVPTLPFGRDLEYWGSPEKMEAPAVLKNDSLHRFWMPAQVENEKPSQNDIAAVMNRTFHYTGQFVPVKWKCRVKMPNGKLCERMDRVKCPFHGKIIARDEEGEPATPADDKSQIPIVKQEPMDTEEEQPEYKPWLDAELQADIEAATGHDLGSKRSKAREEKAKGSKGKGKGKKKKEESGLTNIKAAKNTTRSRLEAKVFSKRALKRVASALDSADYKRVRDKFGSQFNYAIKK